jgi:hypothetical protein
MFSRLRKGSDFTRCRPLGLTMERMLMNQLMNHEHLVDLWFYRSTCYLTIDNTKPQTWKTDSESWQQQLSDYLIQTYVEFNSPIIIDWDILRHCLFACCFWILKHQQPGLTANPTSFNPSDTIHCRSLTMGQPSELGDMTAWSNSYSGKQRRKVSRGKPNTFSWTKIVSWTNFLIAIQIRKCANCRACSRSRLPIIECAVQLVPAKCTVAISSVM